jgi:hypothetical protein
MSALPPKADIAEPSLDVRFVPEADSCAAAKVRYSITSSASISINGGTSRPSASAVALKGLNFQSKRTRAKLALPGGRGDEVFTCE